jgi:hypothetical protein
MAWFLVLFIVSAVPVLAGSDEEMAKDLCFMKGKPWLEVQGRSGFDASSLNLLTTLNRGVPIEREFLGELVREWHARYDGVERLAAIEWCAAQADQYLDNSSVRAYWLSQALNLRYGEISFSKPGTSFDQMRAWAYFAKVYPLGTQVNDYWNGSPAGPMTSRTTWGRIQKQYH